MLNDDEMDNSYQSSMSIKTLIEIIEIRSETTARRQIRKSRECKNMKCDADLIPNFLILGNTVRVPDLS